MLKEKINSFDVLKEMAKRNQYIAMAPLSNIIAMDKKGDKHTFTIGVSPEVFNDYAVKNLQFNGGLILALTSDYKLTEMSMEEAPIKGLAVTYNFNDVKNVIEKRYSGSIEEYIKEEQERMRKIITEYFENNGKIN